MDKIKDRAILLVRIAGPKRLSQAGDTNHERWKNISKGAIRMSTEEISVLIDLYPQYALWLASGKIAPEIGQTSPEYDEANSKLVSQNA
ncbi:DNA-binding protein, partial [Pseudomonas aeruginosa]|uniref:DNA-binding protein n=1 Tax=Pseudomonas aeruginosa TaxID=287 RepID=UPI00104F936B